MRLCSRTQRERDVRTVGKESQGGNKSIKSVSMWHLGIPQSTLGATKAFRRSEGPSGSVQDIKSDKPSGLQYQTRREGKPKPGVSSNSRYPHSGKGHRAMQSSGGKKGGRDIWGLIPPIPQGCCTHSGPGARPPPQRSRSCFLSA